MKYNDLKAYCEELQTEIGVLEYQKELLRREISRFKLRSIPSLFKDYCDFDTSDIPLNSGYIEAITFLLKNRNEIKRRFTREELRNFKDRYWIVRRVNPKTLAEFKKLRILRAKDHAPIHFYIT